MLRSPAVPHDRGSPRPSLLRQLAQDGWVRLSIGMAVLGVLALLPLWLAPFRKWHHSTGIGPLTRR